MFETDSSELQPDADTQQSSAVQSCPSLCARQNGPILSSAGKQGIKLMCCAALQKKSRTGGDNRLICLSGEESS